MKVYVYENEAWPHFVWDESQIQPLLTAVHYQQGRLMGKLESLGFHLREDAALEILIEDIVKTSEIEGESLNLSEVRSSIAQRLGLEDSFVGPRNRNVDGIVEVMLDATQNFAKPLTKDRILGWHAALFPRGYSGISPITVGAFRKDIQGRMQVISGWMNRETVHFQAPKAALLASEMDAFLNWFNGSMSQDSLLVAAIAHLWFVTLHPFDDGNGRIARAIADLALTRSEGISKRFYSMSSQIQKERKIYYLKLEETQKGGMDITPWLLWFLTCLGRAIQSTQYTLDTTIQKARFWERLDARDINPRQKKVLNLLLQGFEGDLTSSKWAKLCHCSQDTAQRDIQDLIVKKILRKGEGGGRSTRYVMREEESKI